jgi:putative FmdB family regulatory protein
MPIYEYRCDNEHRFEAFQAMADDALDTCEVCGAPAQRVLSAPAVHFKGSGFYTTDYARKGKAKPGGDGGSGEKAGAEKKSDSGGSSDSGSSSDSNSKSEASSK